MEYRDNGAFYRICGDVIQVWETVTWTVYFMHSTTIWPRPSKFFVLFFCFICRGKWQPGIKAEQLTIWTLAMPRPRSSVINSAICRKVWTSFSLQILCVPSRTHLLPTFKKKFVFPVLLTKYRNLRATYFYSYFPVIFQKKSYIFLNLEYHLSFTICNCFTLVRGLIILYIHMKWHWSWCSFLQVFCSQFISRRSIWSCYCPTQNSSIWNSDPCQWN